MAAIVQWLFVAYFMYTVVYYIDLYTVVSLKWLSGVSSTNVPFTPARTDIPQWLVLCSAFLFT